MLYPNVNSKKIVEEINNYYSTEIREYIQSGNYEIASMEMSNLKFLANENAKEIVSDIHCGLRYISSLDMLVDALKNSDEKGIKSSQRLFEAFAAQTGLPIKERIE